MIFGGVRKTIGFLQLYPIVTSLFVIIDIVLDFLNVTITSFLCTFFGTSLYVTIGLYCISKSLYVSTWSRVLYITLIVAILFDFIDQLICFPIIGVEFNELILLIFTVGTTSSLFTYVYDKFKYKL